MRLIIRLLLLGIIAYFTSALLPWWNIVVVAFLLGFSLPGNIFGSFLSGFLGAGLLWLGVAWKTDVETGQIMSDKIVELLPMVDDVTYLLIGTALLGGVMGGFGMMTGTSFRQIFIKKKTSGLYG